MRKIAAFCMLMTATTCVVAVPPYEPLPNSDNNIFGSGSTSSTTSTSPATATHQPQSSQTQVSGGQNSGVTTYGIGGSDTPETFHPAVDNTQHDTASSGWDSYSQMQQMQQDLQNLRGTVEQLSHQLDIMRQQERERYLDLDMRINQLRNGATTAPAANDALEEAPPAPNKSESPQQLAQDKADYDQASQLRRDSKFPESIAKMEALLKRSPDGPYAPYCEYWLGEMYMAINPPQMEVAKRHFITLISKYPDHVKIPDALYKLGKLFALQGEKDKARSTLNELIKKYPNKSAANLGKELMKTL